MATSALVAVALVLLPSLLARGLAAEMFAP